MARSIGPAIGVPSAANPSLKPPTSAPRRRTLAACACIASPKSRGAPASSKASCVGLVWASARRRAKSSTAKVTSSAPPKSQTTSDTRLTPWRSRRPSISSSISIGRSDAIGTPERRLRSSRLTGEGPSRHATFAAASLSVRLI